VQCDAQIVECYIIMIALMQPLFKFKSAAVRWGHLILAPKDWPGYNCIFTIYFNIVLSFMCSPKNLFTSGFLTNFLFILQFSHVGYKPCPSHLQNFNTLTSGEEYTLWSPTLCSFLQPPLTSSLLHAHMLLSHRVLEYPKSMSIPYSERPSSDSHKRNKIIVLCTVLFTFTHRR
jgi:hypothetical protein